MSKPVKFCVIILALILGLLALAYGYGVGTQWDEMTKRPVRASYFLADLTILFPLGIAAIQGLVKQKLWGNRVFLMTLGVLLFDMAHQFYYLCFDNYFGVPLVFVFLVMALLVVYAVYGYRAVSNNQ